MSPPQCLTDPSHEQRQPVKFTRLIRGTVPANQFSPVPRTYDVFLVMHPYRRNLAEFRVLIRPLRESARCLAGAEGYYCDPLDTALVALRFHRPADERHISRILAIAALPGLPMVVPEQLSARERRYFFLQHVTRHGTYVQQYANYQDRTPLVERVLETLSQHLAPTISTHAGRGFDVERELPLYSASTQTRRRHRADTQLR